MDEKYKNWNIQEGDYERHYDSPLKYTDGYKAKLRFKKFLKIFFGSLFTLILIAVIIAALA